MTVDLVTIAAQLVNFVVLVALLQLTLYRPVRTAMDARRAEIAQEQANAEEARRDAEREAADLRAAREAYEREQDARLETKERELQAFETTRRAEIDEAARATRTANADALARDLLEAREALLLRLGELLRGELERGFDALADRSVDELVAATLKRQLENLPSDAHATLRAAVLRQPAEGGSDRREAATAPIVVTTARPASDRFRNDLLRVLSDATGREVTATFETDPAILAGVRVRMGAREFGWCAAGVTDRFERIVREVAAEVHGPQESGGETHARLPS